MGTHRRILR